MQSRNNLKNIRFKTERQMSVFLEKVQDEDLREYYESDDYNPDNHVNRFCHDCNLVRPPRASHCILCNR
jgi:hypothetical protein